MRRKSYYQVVAQPSGTSERLLSLLIIIWLLVNFITSPFAFAYGIKSWDQCPVEEMIPIFLTVQGGVSICFVILFFCLLLCCNDEEKPTALFRSGMMGIIIFVCFLVVWHVIGSIWVFTNWKLYSQEHACNSSVFMLSFLFLIVQMICYSLAMIVTVFHAVNDVL
ncbi:uncharacterized protein LOC130625390 [Hydractinia symbiolongicarpus]|uniref:uncharacterized protein LOC130625390 n=1 Tax=Hydractinia symbiolongicarpus TaxID=13093 RepID=UPI002551B059|nr:uncharacterized protein LOC130625390 [Hydractinia symbiolongicarpus]